MGERVWAVGERLLVVAVAVVGLSAFAVLGALVVLPSSSASAAPGPLVPPLIAFQSNRDAANNFEIYKMNGDGSEQTRLFSNTDQSDVTPAWSPDGTKIAFGSSRDGNSEIYVMASDGSAQTRLTNAVGSDNAPSWSPDGIRIAFVSNRDGNSEIYLMNADGSAQTRVTANTASEALPTWSPDATRLAFTSNRDGNNQVYVMNVDGSGQTRLSSNTASESMASWSPDGTRIAFSSNRDGNFEIYTMNADGSAPTRLTFNTTTDILPAWSPDGTKLAFVPNRDGNSDIYVMNADGSGQTRLTINTVADSSPNWQRTAPGAPTGVTATAADGQATVSFTPPASNGGATVSSYTVVATPGPAQASGSGSPITLTGLSNGTTYTFTVSASNGAGTGPVSAPSNAVTPMLVDTTPPLLSVPGDFAVDATSPAGATVEYTVSATDAVDPAPLVVCVPASGTLFPIGDTPVDCTATDAAGNSTAAGFVVHVRGAAEQLAELEQAVAGVGPGNSLASKTQQSQASLAANDQSAACATLAALINQVQAQTGKTIQPGTTLPAQAGSLIASATQIQNVIGC